MKTPQQQSEWDDKHTSFDFPYADTRLGRTMLKYAEMVERELYMLKPAREKDTELIRKFWSKREVVNEKGILYS